MGLFSKIFKKEPATPSAKEAIEKLQETEDMLDKKRDYLDDKIRDAIETARKHGTANKRLALRALKQKKLYEKDRENIDGVLETIIVQKQSLENAVTNAEIFQIMGHASKALEQMNKKMNLDDVEIIMDKMAEYKDMGEEISQALASSSFGQFVDEDDLMLELETLETTFDEDLLELEEASISDDGLKTKLPEAPTEEPQRKKHTDKKDEDEFADLQSWATA